MSHGHNKIKIRSIIIAAVMIAVGLSGFSVSAIDNPDDPTVRGQNVNQIAPRICGYTEKKCQEEFKAAANICIDIGGINSVIADCIISKVKSADLSSRKSEIILGIGKATGEADEVKDHYTGNKSKCYSMILGFPAWYNGLQCDKYGPKINNLNNIWVIVLNVIRWLLGVAAYASAIFIIWGGFKYIKSQGDPSAVASAKTTLVQAIGGLGIALLSTALVAYVQSLFGE